MTKVLELPAVPPFSVLDHIFDQSHFRAQEMEQFFTKPDTIKVLQNGVLSLDIATVQVTAPKILDGNFAFVFQSTSKHQHPTEHQQNQAYNVSTVMNATYSSRSDGRCLFRVQQSPNLHIIKVTVDGVSIPVVIYSGATINMIDLDTYYIFLKRKNYAFKLSIVYVWLKKIPRTFGAKYLYTLNAMKNEFLQNL